MQPTWQLSTCLNDIRMAFQSCSLTLVLHRQYTEQDKIHENKILHYVKCQIRNIQVKLYIYVNNMVITT